MQRQRILAVSSQVAYGPVGNSAAVPALQAMGHEVLAVPTVLLSNHPGHGPPAALRIAAPDLGAMLGVLDERRALDSCAAVMTGYFAANDQIHGIARTIRRMREKNPGLYYLLDPILGDGQALYVPLPVAEAIREHLLPLASCITPNRFELEWLSGRTVTGRDEAVAAARATGVAEVLATSVPAGADALATLAIGATGVDEHTAPIRRRVPHGTGDFLAGLYLARRLRQPPGQALAGAMAVLDRAMDLSQGTAVLDVAGALHG